jgi:hypothetical protein
MDVQRYLADEPVQACPPSAWYRFRKFTRRHKAPVMTVASGVVWGLVGMLFGFYIGTSTRGENPVPTSPGTSSQLGEWVSVLLGAALSVLGWYVLGFRMAVKNAKGAREKAFVVRSMVLSGLVCIAFFLGVTLLAAIFRSGTLVQADLLTSDENANFPGWYRHLLWVPFIMFSFFANRWHKRVVSRIRREESWEG